MIWKPGYRLKWEDFQGLPDNYSEAGAIAATSIGFTPFLEADSSITFVAHSWFSRNCSWVKLSWKTPHVLSHEQGHFDIAEVYARKLRSVLKANKFNLKNLNGAHIILDSIRDEELSMQRKYDAETTRPVRQHQQTQWNKKIALWLKEYEN